MGVGDAQTTSSSPTIVKAPETGFNWFRSHYDMVQQDWRNRRQRYQKFYALLTARANNNPTPYLSDLRSRLIQQQVNTYQAFLLTALLPSYPYVYAETVEPYRTFPMFALESEATEEFNARLRQAKFYSFMDEWIRSAIIHGVGFLKISNGRFRVPDTSNCAWDLSCNGNTRQDCSYFMERITHLDMMTIKGLMKQGIFNKLSGEKFKKLMETAPPADETGDYNADKEFRYRERLYNTSPRNWGTGIYRRPELIECTTPGKRLWVNPQTEIVLGEIPNESGYVNYYALQPFPETNEVQGWALPEMLEDIQEEMNANLAQATDNASLASNVLTKVRRNSGLDPYNMRVQPGKVYPVNDLDDIEFFQPQYNGRELYNHRGEMQLQADRLAGIMAHTRGESGPASMKATVANMLNTNVNVRLNATANRIIDTCLRDLMGDFMMMVVNDPNPVKLPRNEWEAVRSIVNRGLVELVPHPESFVGNQMAKQQQLLNLLQMVPALGVIGPRGIGALVQEIVLLSGMRDPERITQDLAPMMPQDVQAGAAELPGGQMGAGGAGALGGSPTGIPMTQAMAQQSAAGQLPMPAGMQL